MESIEEFANNLLLLYQGQTPVTESTKTNFISKCVQVYRNFCQYFPSLFIDDFVQDKQDYTIKEPDLEKTENVPQQRPLFYQGKQIPRFLIKGQEKESDKVFLIKDTDNDILYLRRTVPGEENFTITSMKLEDDAISKDTGNKCSDIPFLSECFEQRCLYYLSFYLPTLDSRFRNDCLLSYETNLNRLFSLRSIKQQQGQ